MENKRLEAISSYIGQHFTASPSPFTQWLNGKVMAASEDSVEFQYVVRKDMTNPVGMLHGGVISSMFDDCMGITLFLLNTEYFYPTISLNVDFFHGAREGEIVTVRTKAVKQGQTIVNIKAEMLNESSRLLATATTNMAVSKVKIPY